MTVFIASGVHVHLTASMIQQPSTNFDTQEIAEEDLDRDEGEGSVEDITSDLQIKENYNFYIL